MAIAVTALAVAAGLFVGRCWLVADRGNRGRAWLGEHVPYGETVNASDS